MFEDLIAREYTKIINIQNLQNNPYYKNIKLKPIEIDGFKLYDFDYDK